MTPHWTDEQLIEHLYGIGPEDRHIDFCADCRGRLLAMRSRREAIDFASPDGLSFEFLAAQRRRVYEKISQPARWWSQLEPRRWATATAALLVLAGGLLFFENAAHKSAPPNTISDTQLAQDVSRMASDPEPPATAPLQALFEE
jgi:hypothetical protein